ncbi:hypothetical protein I203_102136 [Kwoniella mangroviensis CBS 8507]|uniref:uncharacterized protein n=1 Tax=Kwoniella mangroviensis CBS 8507 TaxID=1296122 RepID=UPI00305ED425
MTSLFDFGSKVVKDIKHETDSEAHQFLRKYIDDRQDVNESGPTIPGILHPGGTGVKADQRSVRYLTDHLDLKTIDLSQWGDEVNEYGPTTGIKELREAVAELYNEEYRQDQESKYTYENVCITPGGRAGMARLAAVIGDVYCAYQIPEYTTYLEVLSVFKRLIPIPTALDARDKYKLNLEQLKAEIENLNLSVVIASNPRNPTGQCISGDELRDLVHLAREKTTVILDEFYSWYQYPDDPKELGTSLSGARYVEDVNEDPVILLNGLTKGFRLPGWRVCWVVAPKNVISAISQSGSFLDGGASHVLQKAAIPLLDYERVQQDKISLQIAFRIKRDHVLDRLEKMGLKVSIPPVATFYICCEKKKPFVFLEYFSIFILLIDLSELDRGLDAIERLLKKYRETPHLLGIDFQPSPTRN